jgi:SAM-dependent methyltransferase
MGTVAFDWSMLTPAPLLALADAAVEGLFWSFHPRFRFFKTLRPEARLLDIGAGSGGLQFWRDWGPPPRPDIALYGVDREQGSYAARYEGWEAVDLDAALPVFPGVRFDGFLMSHVLEHLADPPRLLAWMASVAAPEARIYLEWPHPDTRTLPSAEALRAHGFDIQIFNFADDATHLSTPSQAEAAAMLHAAGFGVHESGRIELGLAARELLARGVQGDDMAWRQMGLWGLSGWAAYAIGAVNRSDAPP